MAVSIAETITVVVTVAAGLLLCVADGRDPVLHRVGGGKFSWAPNINFTDWSIHEHFYVGDWLFFGFDKQIYNVLEVNKSSYESCNEKDFIENITRGGRDVFNLTQAKPYYFLSGKGFCFQGMKVSVFVENSPITPIISPNNISFPTNNAPNFTNISPSLQSPSPLLLFTTIIALPFFFLF